MSKTENKPKVNITEDKTGNTNEKIPETSQTKPKKKWLSLDVIALIVALIGGIPGIISVIEFEGGKPDFYLKVQNISVGGGFDDFNKEYQNILFHVFMTNKGEDPIAPIYYEMRLKTIDNKWHKFKPMIIPAASDSLRVNDAVFLNVAQQDLSFFRGAIKKGDAISGTLMFANYDLTKDDLTKGKILKYEITCIDVTDEKFTISIDPPKYNMEPGMIMPLNHIHTETKKEK